MAGDPNKLSQFWQELKRRNVVRVVTVYAGAAFVILELVDIVAEPLKLPSWLIPVVIVLLSIGFIIAVILSWIYDIHPEGGMVKTEAADKGKAEDIPKLSSGWKIASYVSFVVIVGLIVMNIIPRTGKKEILDKSIAILPVHNFSGDPAQEYICDGLTDEIIRNLYIVGSFSKVASLTSVLNYKSTDLDIPDIAERLGVNYILESSFKRIGDQLRFTVQLIESCHDNHIWQHDYDQPYEAIVAIPGDIAIQIADHLNAFMTNAEKEIVSELPTSSLEAYEILQKVHYHNRLHDNISFKDSIQKAIELDPGYADAYADLGFAVMVETVSYLAQPKEDHTSVWDAFTYLDKALELDPDNLSANIYIGVANYWIKWDYIAAEKQFDRVLEITNTSEDFNYLYLEFLHKMNRQEDALFLCLEIDMAATSPAWVYAKKGQFREAKMVLRKALEVSKGTLTPGVADVYIWMEEWDSARFFYESALQMKLSEMEVPWYQAHLALVYQHTHDPQLAQVIIEQLKASSNTLTPGSPDYFLGWYYSGMGEVDSAFYYLERAYRNHSVELTWLKVDPIFESIRNDDRYWDLYKRTGHKAYDEYLNNKME